MYSTARRYEHERRKCEVVQEKQEKNRQRDNILWGMDQSIPQQLDSDSDYLHCEHDQSKASYEPEFNANQKILDNQTSDWAHPFPCKLCFIEFLSKFLSFPLHILHPLHHEQKHILLYHNTATDRFQEPRQRKDSVTCVPLWRRTPRLRCKKTAFLLKRSGGNCVAEARTSSYAAGRKRSHTASQPNISRHARDTHSAWATSLGLRKVETQYKQASGKSVNILLINCKNTHTHTHTKRTETHTYTHKLPMSTTFSSPFPQKSFLFLFPSWILSLLLQDPDPHCCRRRNCSSSPWTKWLLSQIGSFASKYRDLAIFILFFVSLLAIENLQKTLHFQIFGFLTSLFGEIVPVKSKGLSRTRLPRGSRFGGRVAKSGMSCGERRGDRLLSPDGRTDGRTEPIPAQKEKVG